MVGYASLRAGPKTLCPGTGHFSSGSFFLSLRLQTRVISLPGYLDTTTLLFCCFVASRRLFHSLYGQGV